jgi:hypothetical protein
MTKITVVTTFHQAGLEKYGQRLLNSFAERVDKRIKLWAYAENCDPVNPDLEQIVVLDAESQLPKLRQFKNKWKDVPTANGLCPWPARRPRDHHKAFKWDAVRFANKVYAVFDACERNSNWVVWMDADTFVHSDWSYEQFRELLPDTSWITYVGRGSRTQSWPECGFYGLNLDSVVCREFLREFESYYEQAESKMFVQEEWHDSYIFGLILDQFKKTAPNVIDYTSEIALAGATTGGGGHPLINSKLGSWIDHLKGDRKDLGRSLNKDITIVRNESYWQT